MLPTVAACPRWPMSSGCGLSEYVSIGCTFDEVPWCYFTLKPLYYDSTQDLELQSLAHLSDQAIHWFASERAAAQYEACKYIEQSQLRTSSKIAPPHSRYCAVSKVSAHSMLIKDINVVYFIKALPRTLFIPSVPLTALSVDCFFRGRHSFLRTLG